MKLNLELYQIRAKSDDRYNALVHDYEQIYKTNDYVFHSVLFVLIFHIMSLKLIVIRVIFNKKKIVYL